MKILVKFSSIFQLHISPGHHKGPMKNILGQVESNLCMQGSQLCQDILQGQILGEKKDIALQLNLKVILSLTGL